MPQAIRSLHKYRWLLASTGMFVLGAAMRWSGLARFPFEQDELYTLRESRELFATALKPGIEARPLYYLLHHALTPILPAGELGARLLAFAFGLLGLLVTWRLGKLISGRPGGFIALSICAFSPWHLFVSGEARYWSLVYLLVPVTVLQLLKAREREDWGTQISVGLFLVAGALTHPTFMFPMVGVALASLLEPSASGVAFRWPTRRAIFGTWVPAGLVIGGYLLSLKLAGHGNALSNSSGRGWWATLKLVPAMVQLSTTALLAAGIGGVYCGLRWGNTQVKRFSLWATGGIICGVGLLFAASLRTGVYADYGISLLPLAIVGATALLLLARPARATPMALAISGILIAAMLPETASQLSDGMRFDDRPALRTIVKASAGRPSLVWPKVVQEYYAPELQSIEFRYTVAQLDSLASASFAFWVIASETRDGLVHHTSASVQAWLDDYCRKASITSGRRFDYRIYRVVLYDCDRRGARH